MTILSKAATQLGQAKAIRQRRGAKPTAPSMRQLDRAIANLDMAYGHPIQSRKKR